MFCYDSSTPSGTFICKKCLSYASLTVRLLELEARIETLQNIRSNEEFIDSFSVQPETSVHVGSPSVSRSLPAVAASSQRDVFVTVRGKRRGKKLAQPSCPSPVKLFNSFAPLDDLQPDERVPEKSLIIGDSIVRDVRVFKPATTVNCIPGARVTDIEANLKLLDQGKRKFSKIIIHAGTNDIRLRQSEITKSSFKSACAQALKMSRSVSFSGPYPIRCSDEMYSRLDSLNRWLSEWCADNNVGFVDNWRAFRRRPGLLRRDGVHPSREGTALLSRNLAYDLNYCS